MKKTLGEIYEEIKALEFDHQHLVTCRDNYISQGGKDPFIIGDYTDKIANSREKIDVVKNTTVCTIKPPCKHQNTRTERERCPIEGSYDMTVCNDCGEYV